MGSSDITCDPLPTTPHSVSLRILAGGSFIASTAKIHAGVADQDFRLYDWAFYVFNPRLGRHVLWDLGLSGNDDDYTPWVREVMLKPTQAVGPVVPIEEQLLRLGVVAEQIDTVLFSHAHWDHCRPIRHTFPNAIALFGPGTNACCSPGHLANGEPDATVQWDGRYFDPVRATESWHELEGPWQRFGPFEAAMDLFGDGSFWVIQAPGHMPGNLCAAARLSTGDWVLLGSDCCHSRELLDEVYDIAVFELPDGSSSSLQADIPAAKTTIRKIKTAEQKLGMHVALAHDTEWMKRGTDPVLMSLLSEEIKSAAHTRLVNNEIV